MIASQGQPIGLDMTRRPPHPAAPPARVALGRRARLLAREAVQPAARARARGEEVNTREGRRPKCSTTVQSTQVSARIIREIRARSPTFDACVYFGD